MTNDHRHGPGVSRRSALGALGVLGVAAATGSLAVP